MLKISIGNAFCSVVEIRLNVGGLRKKSTISWSYDITLYVWKSNCALTPIAREFPSQCIVDILYSSKCCCAAIIPC